MSKSARELAAKRAAELARRRTELTAGRPVTQEDIDLAWQRAEQSRQRAEEAHRSAAQRYEEAARVHDRVADFYDQAQSLGLGDAATHHAKAQYHRQAAGDDWAAAKQARGAAEHEQR